MSGRLQDTNVLKITKCDNQLIMFAVAEDQMMYQIARVGSGPFVDIEISLVEGAYDQPQPIYNPGPAINKSNVALPRGTYTIYYTGFNAGGPYNFEFTLNEHHHMLLDNPNEPLLGFMWNLGGPTPSNMTVTIA